MRAVAVFPTRREVRVTSHPAPALDSPTAVELRMLEVGVCGTDREICTFQYGTPPAGSDYLVLGHESLGEVTAVGRAVRDFKPGDLVVPMVRRPCDRPECAPCRAGRQDFCVTGEYRERGIRGAHGFMTERVVDDQRWMNRVPRALRDVAVLVEPLTIAEKALLQLAALEERLPESCRHRRPAADGAGAARSGAAKSRASARRGAASRKSSDGRPHRAVVLGAGPVGLLGAMALVEAGYDVMVYSRGTATSPRARVVSAIGAKFLSAEKHAVADLPRLAGNVDVFYEAVGASSLAFEALHALGPNGVFIFTGVPGRKGPISVDTDRLMRDLVLKNQLLLGTVNAGRDAFEAAIRGLGSFLARWPEAVRSLITGRFAMESCMVPIQGGGDGIKSVIVIGEGGARPVRNVAVASATGGANTREASSSAPRRARTVPARAPRRKPASAKAKRPRKR